MTLELLLAEFDGLIQTPADVEKLNATILQWAVQGRLLPQCADDEPASQLLEQITTIKKNLAKAGKIRKPKKLPKLKADSLPFLIPENWEWTQLDEIALDIHYGYTASADPNLADVRLLRITDIQGNRVDWATVPGCVIKEKDIPKYLLEENDILIARTGGTIGKTYIVENVSVKAVFASYLIRVIPPKNISARYLKLFLESPFYWQQLLAKSKGTGQPNVNATSLSQLTVPFPPLAEQKRIVARVDELLGQTAVLTQQLASVHEQRRGVHTAVLHQLTTKTSEVSSERSSPTSEVYTLATHFDRFYVDADTVAELKQAILQLAVQGRLVPQDERDEDAAVLLARIAAENDLEIENQRIPYVPIELICDVRGGIQKSKNRRPDKNPIRYLTVAHVQRNWIDFSDERFFEVYPDELERWRLLSGDNLVVEGNGSADHIGRTAIFRGEIENCVHQNHLIRVRPNQELLDPEYLNLFLNSPEGRGEMLERSRTTSGLFNLSVGRIQTIKVPLPPIEEQKRIVAKVDELFALCDQLAGQLTTTAASRTQLLEAVLAQA